MKAKNALFILSSLFLLFPNQNYSQSNTVKLLNKTYFEEEAKWFSIDKVTNEKFEVNTRSMTVKLEDESYRARFEDLCKTHNVIIENVNILGYYDLVLPENSKFYEMFTKFEESNLFSSVEIISYAKLLGSDDPGFDSQYYLDNSSGLPDINIEAAWAIETGSPSVIIAVIDEGVDNDNTDIDGNIWASYGWDYVGNDSNPDPAEIEHHGTSVAGVIAAETNNGSAVAGIAGGWNSAGCKIMSLRFHGSIYNEQTEEYEYVKKPQSVDDAIIFAANHGAKIINMSFSLDLHPDVFSSVDAAIEYAYKSKGCLLIAASGNPPSKECISYPARNDNVVAIGGIDKYFGNYGKYGPELEIVAPAVDIYTLRTSNTQSPANWGLFGSSGNGTSASSPQVAGTAALILSKYPNWINYDVRKILNESAYDLGDQLKFGNGLLQANNALLQANPTYQSNNNQPQNVTLSGSYGSNPTITWDEIPGNDIDDYNIYRAQIVDGVYSHFGIIASVYPGGNNTNSWTDNSVVRINPRFASSTHFYRVTSIHINGVESATSNEVSTGSNWANKKAIEDEQTVTYEYNLGNNFPNPFNPSTIIRYSLKENGIVTLTVTDVLGRVVKNLLKAWQPEGVHEINFNTNNQLSSGIYFYTIKVNDFCITKKLMIMK